MSQRFPAEEADLSFHKELEQYIHNVHGKELSFEWKGDGNELFGLYPALLHSPDVAPGFWSMAKSSFSPEAIDPRNRELAIIGLLSIIKTPYVIWSHRQIAKKVGITDEQYTSGLQGITPEGLGEKEAMAYQLGRTLTGLKSPLSDEMWDDAVGKLGKKEVLAVAHIIGGYFYISMLTNLNGHDQRFE